MTTMNDLPPGWSAKPEDFCAYQDDWETEDGFGNHLCEQLKLGEGHPLLYHRDNHAYLFEAAGKFYLWYCIGLDLLEITSPKTRNEIINIMKENGEGAVKTRRLL